MNDYGTRSSADLETRSNAESVVERVYLSVEHLCTAKGDVRNRLIGAVSALLPLRFRDFPKELQQDFDWVIKQSTKFQPEFPQQGGRLEVTMKRIKNSTGEKIAKRIFYIYSTIQDIRGFPLLEYRNPNE
jgi:hypothetical protein